MLLLPTFFILLQGANAISICGNYCGPTWCNAQIESECSNPVGLGCRKTVSDCSEIVPTDGSCADACCKIHDSCCGSSNREPCNDAIIACLGRCENGPNDDCKDPSTGLAVHPKFIMYLMKLNPFGCCGTRCSKSGSGEGDSSSSSSTSSSSSNNSTKRDELYSQFQADMETSKDVNITQH